jgi:hypothetical protein
MKKIYALITATCFVFGYNFAIAEPADSGPPAQQQKNEVSPSTTHGDYLEPQPDENGATAKGNNANSTDQKAHKAKKSKSNAKPANTEKGKSHTEEPESGGVEVQQK